MSKTAGSSGGVVRGDEASSTNGDVSVMTESAEDRSTTTAGLSDPAELEQQQTQEMQQRSSQILAATRASGVFSVDSSLLSNVTVDLESRSGDGDDRGNHDHDETSTLPTLAEQQGAESTATASKGAPQPVRREPAEFGVSEKLGPSSKDTKLQSKAGGKLPPTASPIRSQTSIAAQKQEIMNIQTSAQVAGLQNEKMRVLQAAATTKQLSGKVNGVASASTLSSQKSMVTNNGTNGAHAKGAESDNVSTAAVASVNGEGGRGARVPGAVAMNGRPLGASSADGYMDDLVNGETYPSDNNGGAVTATAISPDELEQEVLGRIMDRAITAVMVDSIQPNGGNGTTASNDSKQAADPETKDDRKTTLIGRVILVLVVLVVLIVTGLAVRRNNKKNDRSPFLSDSPTTSPTELTLTTQQLEMLDFLQNISSWDGASEALMDRSSPQFQAFWWLSNDPFVEAAVVSPEFGDDEEEGAASMLRSSAGNKTSTSVSNSTKMESSESSYLASLFESQDIVAPRYAMAVFFYSTEGPTMWTKNDNWLSDVSICDWYTTSPVSSICDMNGDLTRLEIRKNGWQGVLPEELVFLTKLDSIIVAENRLQGSLPSEWVSSDHSNFTASLVDLDISDNYNLTGDVTDILWQLTSLSSLKLANLPNVTATLTSEMGLLSNLKRLVAPEMTWMGTLPTEIGLWNQVETINIPSSSSVVNGSIPMELWELPLLDEIDLSGWGLSGTLPDFDASDSPGLHTLKLGGNALEGRLPPSLVFWTNLRELQLDDNQFGVGLFLPDEEDQDFNMIPTELGGLSNLEILTLTNNPSLGVPPAVAEETNRIISNTIPTEFGRLTNLVELELSKCALTSTVPTELGLMTSLTLLSADDNVFSGTFPTEIGSLTALTELSIAKSEFLEGTIPSELGLLTNLEVIHLAGPRRKFGTAPPDPDTLPYLFHGTIPQTFTYLSKLEWFDLGYHKLSGTFPQTTFLSMTNMRWFVLKQNQLESTIPPALGKAFSKIEYFDVGHNHLTGIFSTKDLAHWTNLKAYKIQRTQLSGSMRDICDLWEMNDKAVEVVADCEEIKCFCCTACCNAEGCGPADGNGSRVPKEGGSSPGGSGPPPPGSESSSGSGPPPGSDGPPGSEPPTR